MAALSMTPNALRRITEQAKLKGYDDPVEYVLDLVEAAAEGDEPPGRYSPELGERFKESFKDGLRGNVMSWEELRSRLADDD